MVNNPWILTADLDGAFGDAPIAYSGKDLKKFTIAKAWEYNFSNDVSNAPKSTGIKQLMEGGRVSKMESKDRSKLYTLFRSGKRMLTNGYTAGSCTPDACTDGWKERKKCEIQWLTVYYTRMS